MSKGQSIGNDIIAAMSLFCYDTSGKITTKEVGPVVRSVGLNPTESELKELNRAVDSQFGGKIDGPSLTKLLEPKMKDYTTTSQELREALQAFDKTGTQTVDTQDFSDALCSLGEPLSRNIVEEMIRDLDRNGEGKINIDDIVLLLAGKS